MKPLYEKDRQNCGCVLPSKLQTPLQTDNPAPQNFPIFVIHLQRRRRRNIQYFTMSTWKLHGKPPPHPKCWPKTHVDLRAGDQISKREDPTHVDKMWMSLPMRLSCELLPESWGLTLNHIGFVSWASSIIEDLNSSWLTNPQNVKNKFETTFCVVNVHKEWCPWFLRDYLRKHVVLRI
jgi:hypothetical protein